MVSSLLSDSKIQVLNEKIQVLNERQYEVIIMMKMIGGNNK